MKRLARTLSFVAIAMLLASVPLLAQSDWSAVRPNPTVTIEIRRLVGLLMLLPAVTMFLLYAFRPRPYVLAAGAAWGAATTMMLLLSVDSGGSAAGSPERISLGRAAVAGWAIAALAFGAGIRLTGAWFRAPARMPRALPWTFAIAVGYTIFAATMLGAMATGVPAFALMTWWLLHGALLLLRAARQHNLIGLLVTALGVLGLVVVNLTALTVLAMNLGSSATRVGAGYLSFLSAAVLILGMHLLIFEDVIQELRLAATELAKSRDEMKAMANTDPLTKCYNRRFLYEIMERHLEQHRRYNMPLSLLYIDIDHFKAINDQRGHHTGDEVLKTMGAILNELTRKGDYVFRWGGDEFIVLLSATEEDARLKCDQIRRAFVESVIVQNLPDGVDVSIGIVAVPPETRDLDPLIDQADREMYRRKRALAS